MQVLGEMTELLSSCRNYDNYRRAYGECTHFKIPILGVHLKDLISLYEAMPDYLEDGKVNVHKLLALYNHINELVQLQEVAPPLEANKDLVHLLTVSATLTCTLLHTPPGHKLLSPFSGSEARRCKDRTACLSVAALRREFRW